MAFDLSEAEHRVLEAHLDATLDAYKEGRITLSQARTSLAHFITAGVIDDEREFKNYIRLRPEEIFNTDRS